MIAMLDVYDNEGRISDANDQSTSIRSRYSRILNPYIELTRPADIIVGLIGLIAAAFVASGTNIADHMMEAIIVSIAVVFYIAGGNSINDSVDGEVDRIAHPDRPVPCGKISSTSAFHFGLICLALALASSVISMDPLVIMIVGVACVAITAYEMILKKKGFIGNITIAALTGASFILGGAMVHNISACFVLSATVFMITLGREIQKDIMDKDGDSADRKTLPMRIGVERSSVVARLSYVVAVIISSMPLMIRSSSILYASISIADVMLLISASGRVDTKCSERIAKYSILAVIVASVLGTLHL